MEAESDLPQDVVAALEAGRKIEAIRLLREHRGVGLKEAKQEIESYARGQAPASGIQAPKAETGVGRLMLIVAITVAAFLGYQYLV